MGKETNGGDMKEKFLNYLRDELNRSELTVKSYDEDLRAFEAYFRKLDSLLSWESVDSDVIRDWMESMMDRGNSATTVNRRLSALRSLYRFALSRGLVAADPAYGIAGLKHGKPLPKFFKETDLNRLFDDVGWGTTYKDTRARTIILCFYTTGLRLAELIALDDRNVDYRNMQLKVTGKGNKQRIVPFGKELAAALQAYQEMRDGTVFKTSAANEDDFRKAFTPILEAGRDILYIGFSLGLSSTVNGKLSFDYYRSSSFCYDVLCKIVTVYICPRYAYEDRILFYLP